MNTNLKTYLERKNLWRNHTGEPDLTTDNLTPKDFESLFDSIENDLSPENLHCDGEISRAEAQKKYKFLMSVQKELETLYYAYHPE